MSKIKTGLQSFLGKVGNKIGSARKRTIIIVAVVVVAIAALGLGVLAARWKIQRLSSGYMMQNYFGGKYGRMMGKHATSIISDDENKFYLPQDAAKSGELAIVVDDLSSAKIKVDDAAAKNGGNVYATQIAYASSNVKSGSIVVQIPAGNFEETFSDLKKIGSQIVQESTRKIPEINYGYPQPLSAAESVAQAEPVTSDAVSDSVVSSEEEADDSQGSDTAVSSPVIATMPISYQQSAQDKGYIKVIFVDYGKSAYVGNGGNRSDAANIIGVGYAGQNLRDNLFVIMAIKSVLLIVMIAIIVIVAKKIIHHLRKLKNKKPTVHVVVKQTTKTRATATKTKARKRL